MAASSPRSATIRPNPLLGACYYVPADHTGERADGGHPNSLAAYPFPPSIRSAPNRSPMRHHPVPAFFPDSVIGPVVGVDHTAAATAVLINNLWVTVWSTTVHAPCASTTPIPGVSHVLPLPTRPLPLWTNGPWDHPFQDLWLYTPDLGISHLAAPGRHSSPRFLLTGAAWFRLCQVHAFLRCHPSGDLLRGGLSARDRLMLARTLHLSLDYPLIPNGPHRSSGLALLQQADLVPRQRISAFLRIWIRRKRTARAALRTRLLHGGRLVPPCFLPLGNIIGLIAECL